jgi:hypothetical protein
VTPERLNISVLTACTGLKIQAAGTALTRTDFLKGRRHIATLHRRLAPSLVSAERLYLGQQHVRLMRGVDAARRHAHLVSVSIVSAGYGLLAGDDAVVPYECTFQGMSSRERRAWAERLSLEASVKECLAHTADAAIVLLGHDYFSACALTGELAVGAPTVVLCGARSGLRMRPANNVYPVVLREQDTRRFACGLVGLKGEVAGRLLGRLARDPGFVRKLASPRLLDELERSPLAHEVQALA